MKGNRWLEKTIEYIEIQWAGLCKASHPLDLVNLSERFCQETIPLLIRRKVHNHKEIESRRYKRKQRMTDILKKKMVV